MLRPNKYMDYTTSIINISATIISNLKVNNIKYNDLENKIIEKHGKNAKYQFANSINFLYLLGKVDYNTISDEVVLIN